MAKEGRSLKVLTLALLAQRDVPAAQIRVNHVGDAFAAEEFTQRGLDGLGPHAFFRRNCAPEREHGLRWTIPLGAVPKMLSPGSGKQRRSHRDGMGKHAKSTLLAPADGGTRGARGDVALICLKGTETQADGDQTLATLRPQDVACTALAKG